MQHGVIESLLCKVSRYHLESLEVGCVVTTWASNGQRAVGGINPQPQSQDVSKKRSMELILCLEMDRNTIVGTTHQCSNWNRVRHTIKINPLVFETVSQKRVAFNHKKFLSGIVTDEINEHRSWTIIPAQNGCCTPHWGVLRRSLRVLVHHGGVLGYCLFVSVSVCQLVFVIYLRRSIFSVEEVTKRLSFRGWENDRLLQNIVCVFRFY